jgi:membrane protein DedA with SNARE-associated domain
VRTSIDTTRVKPNGRGVLRAICAPKTPRSSIGGRPPPATARASGEAPPLPPTRSLRQDQQILLAFLEINARVAYWALFVLVAVESSGVPVPGETALIAAGVLASKGRVHIEYVIAIAGVAAIIGDNIGYLIGRTGGRRLLERPGFLEDYRRGIIKHGEPFFQRHGAKAVFLGRWVAGLRIAAAWLAGINRMDWKRFMFWNGLGGIAWATSVGLLAYWLGPTAEKIFRTLGIAGVSLAALALLGFVLWRRLGDHGD